MDSPIVNTFLIGAPKCGTTTLAAYLEAHPEVFVPSIKESNFFATDIDPKQFSSTYRKWVTFDAEAYFKNPHRDKVQTAFLKKEQHYKMLYSGASDKAVVDASTSYMFSKKAAQNIFDYNPNSKIIAVLRQPAQRAFSHYLMALRYGLVKTPFEIAWRNDLTFVERTWGKAELFADLGKYGTQLQRYFNLFSPKQILVLRYEELKTDPKKVFDLVCDFLKVDRFDPGTLPHENAGRLPRFHGFYPQRMTRLKEGMKKAMPKSWFERVKNLAYAQKPLPSLPPEIEREITDFYKDEIKLLQHISKQDFSDWLKQQ